MHIFVIMSYYIKFDLFIYSNSINQLATAEKTKQEVFSFCDIISVIYNYL